MSTSILSLDGSATQGEPAVRGEALKKNADGAYRDTAQIGDRRRGTGAGLSRGME
jgi:hypothetical protein